jgi:hypothetical protein
MENFFHGAGLGKRGFSNPLNEYGVEKTVAVTTFRRSESRTNSQREALRLVVLVYGFHPH